MITTIKKKIREKERPDEGLETTSQGTVFRNAAEDGQGDGSPAWWSHARGTCARRPETKMAGAASERLFRRVGQTKMAGAASQNVYSGAWTACPSTAAPEERGPRAGRALPRGQEGPGLWAATARSLCSVHTLWGWHRVSPSPTSPVSPSQRGRDGDPCPALLQGQNQGPCLVAQGLRLSLPMQGAWV